MKMIFELPNCSPSDAGRPSAQTIYDLLKSAILNGELGAGCKLPPTRLSSKRFGLSRSTMVSIYARLCTEDLAESRRGSGTYVSARRQPLDPASHRSSTNSPPAWITKPIERKAAPLNRRAPGIQRPDALDLRPGFIDPKLFPFDRFRKSMAKALRQMERSPAMQSSEVNGQGDPRLRRAIADHAALMRAIACDPDDMMITSGVRAAMDLIARSLVERGATLVAVEGPRHCAHAEPFEAAGATVCAVPVDQDGMIVDAIPDDANIICVSSSSQPALGVAMSADRRRQFHALTRERNCIVIEDDFGGEFRTGGDPLQSLYSLAPDRCFYLGNFSTAMLPSFRLGYLIAPGWAIESLVSSDVHAEWQSSSVMQAAAASFITDGYLSAHIGKMRALYADRKEALVEAIRANFGDFLVPLHSGYGLNLSALGNPAINWKSVYERARMERIQVRPLSLPFGTPPQSGLQFGIGAEPPERIRLAIERLAAFI